MANEEVPGVCTSIPSSVRHSKEGPAVEAAFHLAENYKFFKREFLLTNDSLQMMIGRLDGCFPQFTEMRCALRTEFPEDSLCEEIVGNTTLCCR